MSDAATPEESGRKLRRGPIRQAIRDIVPSRADLAELRQFLQEVTMAELESRYPG